MVNQVFEVGSQPINNALRILIDAKNKKKAVFIPTEIKSELQQLCHEYPDIKMNYFAGDAIHKAIVIERMKREEKKFLDIHLTEPHREGV